MYSRAAETELLGQQLVEQLAGAADEGTPGQVLVAAGPLAHEHEVGWVADAEDDLGPRVGQGSGCNQGPRTPARRVGIRRPSAASYLLPRARTGPVRAPFRPVRPASITPATRSGRSPATRSGAVALARPGTTVDVGAQRGRLQSRHPPGEQGADDPREHVTGARGGQRGTSRRWPGGPGRRGRPPRWSGPSGRAHGPHKKRSAGGRRRCGRGPGEVAEQTAYSPSWGVSTTGAPAVIHRRPPARGRSVRRRPPPPPPASRPPTPAPRHRSPPIGPRPWSHHRGVAPRRGP